MHFTEEGPLAESLASQLAHGLSLSPEFQDYKWPGFYVGPEITDGHCTCAAFTVLYPVSYLLVPLIFLKVYVLLHYQ